MLRIGLTGGLASGKSAVAAYLKELGAIVFDADAIVSDLYRPGGRGARAAEQLFGKEVLDAEGRVDRARVAAIVFASPRRRHELEARIHAVLRRLGPDVGPDGRLRLGPIELDPVRRSVTVAGDPVHFSPREYELLKVLLSNQGRLVTRERLLRAVWGHEHAGAREYLHVYVGRLRHKLADAGVGPAIEQMIATEPGIGYRVAAPPPAVPLEAPAAV